MRSDYLWNGSGEPDPELQRMEKALTRFRHSGKAFDFPAADFPLAKPRRFTVFTPGWVPRFAAAALVAAALVGSGLFLHVAPTQISSSPAWNVAPLSGAPRVGSVSLAGNSGKAQLQIGQLLVTDDSSRASLNVAEVGQIFVDPGTRVRLLESGSKQNRLALELGTIHAAIWAPPGEFTVDTPSATAVDLGCAYTLHVNDDGSGTIRTSLGWVGFHKDGRDSFIPAGAMCSTRRVQGPGTPYFEDASDKLREALHALDFDSLPAADRARALHAVVAHARHRDAFTLWHLLSRVSDDERPLVYDRLAELVPAPAGVTREETLALEPKMLDAWWNAFELGDITVWRYWEQKQAQPLDKKAGR